MSDWFDAWNPFFFPGRGFDPNDRSELPPEFRRENRDLRIPLKEGPPLDGVYPWHIPQ